MTKIAIKETPNPTIVKFEFSDFISKNQSYEFKNIDEADVSPLAQQLFYLPFVKTVYISGNFIAIERFSIVSWSDVQEAVAEQIEKFIASGGIIIQQVEKERKKQPFTVYGETTPNPSVLKFVVNRILTKTPLEYKNRDQATASPLAKALLEFDYVKEIFIDENYVSITKRDEKDWNEITLELRSFIKQFLENGGMVLEENFVADTLVMETKQKEIFTELDATSQQIINILEEYVKPAVTADGGNIAFDSYNETDQTVRVILQGACSGCPSSSLTLKNGIESLLRTMLHNDALKVEAITA